MKKVSKKTEQNAPDPNRPRPVSAPIYDSPFAQYGTGDEEKETGAKRTHNVLSKEEVGNSIDKPVFTYRNNVPKMNIVVGHTQLIQHSTQPHSGSIKIQGKFSYTKHYPKIYFPFS